MKKLSDKQFEKYSRQIIIESIGVSGQEKIINSGVLIVGCGGLGTSAAQYLSMAGIGKLGLVDDDKIRLSNLNRQTLFTEKNIGMKKVHVLHKKIQEINSELNIFPFDHKLNQNNVKRIFNGFNYILDCSDNFNTRFLVNKYCHKMKKILVTAALQNFDLQAAILNSWDNNNPCYECLISSLDGYQEESCDEMGIVAPVAGIAGAIQANLLINDLLGKEMNYSKIILLSCNDLRMRKIKLNKNPECLICRKT